MKIIRRILWGLIAVAAGFIAGGIILFFALATKIPRLPDDLRVLASSPPTEVYGRNGDLLKRLGGRDYVPLDRIAPDFLNAVIAVEDKRFRTHRGIDHLAVLNAIRRNIADPKHAPGGSTITQQLAKNLFFSFKRSWQRKLLEGLAALAIEDRFSKDEILEAYVNLVYYGRFAYGVERAALTYFGKHAAELTTSEAAMLAGLPNSPSRLNPVLFHERAKERQRFVLERMAANGFIRPDEIDSLADAPLRLVRRRLPEEAGSHAVDFVLESAADVVGWELVNYGGIKIWSSVDPTLQRWAQIAVQSDAAELESRLKPTVDSDSAHLEAALAAVDVPSGQIVAMVGSRDYSRSSYNRAVKSLRQPGSAFKPVIYLTALEQTDLNATSLLVDEPMTIKIGRGQTWQPENYDGTYEGPVVLKLALMKSINTIAAQLIQRTTPGAVVKTAHRLGISAPLEPYYSLALGAQGVPVVEMAGMFGTLARGGVVKPLTALQRIEGQGGEILYEAPPVAETRFAPEVVHQLVDMLTGVLDGGTGAGVRSRGFTAAAIGKTGTSSDWRDSWFCGATPGLAAAVWVGYDDNRPMMERRGVPVTGASGAAPIWADFMLRATSSDPPRSFTRPAGLVRAWVHPTTGVVSAEEAPGLLPVILPTDVLNAALKMSPTAGEPNDTLNAYVQQ